MAKKKKKPDPHRARLANRKLAEGLERAKSLMARSRWAEAAQLLRELDQTYPQRQEVLRAMLHVARSLEDPFLLQYSCERLALLCPHDPLLPLQLIVAYAKSDWRALALTLARRLLAEHPAPARAHDIPTLLATLEPLVQEEMTRLGLDGADGLECLLLHDRIRALLSQQRFAKAHELAQELIQRRPHFSPAYNNGAEACYHDGKIGQALDLTQRLLAFAPDNDFARANLVRYLCAAGKVEEAQREAEQLKAVPLVGKDQAVKHAEALAWLGNDAGMLALFAQSQALPEAPPETEALLYHLAAVAAFRQGREEEAHDHWRSALRLQPHFPVVQGNLDDLKRPIRKRNAPWSYAFTYYVPLKLIDGLMARMDTVRGKDDEAALDREARRFVEAHPLLEGIVPILLDRGDGPGRELAVRLAGMCRTPAMLQAARDFALSQRGPDELRMLALQLAEEAGLLPPGPHRVWAEGAWREVALQRFELHGEPVPQTHAPGVDELLTTGIHALHANDPEKAERVLRQALAIDPSDPVVLNNLAVACAQLGRDDESETLSLLLHQQHPDYLFGRTALASLAAERGELERARQLLEPLLKRTRMHFGEFAALCTAQLHLALAEGNRDHAEQVLAMWRQAIPDHPALAMFEERVRALPRG